MVYQLPNGGAVQARPGEFVRCDCFGRFLRIERYLANGNPDNRDRAVSAR